MGRVFITVVLPLRLEWNPYYYVDVPDVDASACVSSGGAGEKASVACPVQRGDRVKVMVAGKLYQGVVYETGVKPVIPEDKIRPVVSVETLERVSAEELELWKFIADYYMCTIGEVYKAAYPVGRISGEQTGEHIRLRNEARKAKLLTALRKKEAALESRIAKRQEELSKARKEERKQLLIKQLEDLSIQFDEVKAEIASILDETDVASAPNLPEIKLSKAQDVAHKSILKAFDDNKIAFLNGITGSGKTEIYCSLAEETLRQGRNVMYLVPEIALSRQLEDRLRRIFGDFLLTSHSGESHVHRREVAASMREKQYVLLGTRSSIFLPHRDLGLIIIDEEHDTSYKQDNPAPRYNARDCALMMGRIFSCPVIMGSATPSLESLFNASSGRYEMVRLTERYYEGNDAQVEVIDTIAERRKRGMVGSFSRKLIAHIHDTIERGEQVLILRGRKAYSPHVQCDACGSIPRCPHCNVTLSYHKDRNRLVCHYCGHSEPYVITCPECGGNRIPVGTGTQKVEEEVSSLFPDAKVGRLDGDNVAVSAKTISDFAAGRMDILVGTQMVSKGFDFENLTLVAVIQSDSLLCQQDFRADERAVQLLEQLRGRGGRRGKQSLFVIQTSQPDHPVYSRMNSGTDFVAGEMEMRSNFGFPPYTRIVSLVMKDTNQARLEKLSSALSMVLARAFGSTPTVAVNLKETPVSVSFPYAPVVDRVSGESVRHIRVTLRRSRELTMNKARIAAEIASFEKEKAWSGHISIDVDPI